MWTFASLEVEGNTIPQQAIGTSSMAIDGNTFVNSSPAAIYSGTFRLGLAGSTRTIDIGFTEGPEAGRTILGIYELDGDTWTMCLNLAPRKPRPMEFAAPVGSGRALETLVRKGR
jgi:uncharacterized protein (TIGR03067 family)